MATYKFNCSVCNGKVSVQTKYYKSNLKKYFCVNKQELSLKYICKKCRKIRKEKTDYKTKTEIKLEYYPKYNETKLKITQEAIKVQQLGFQNQIIMKTFLQSVKNILDLEGIKEYNFIVENNELKGVTFKMPFIGRVKMKINTKQKQEDYE
jgi:hypothetical protein